MGFLNNLAKQAKQVAGDAAKQAGIPAANLPSAVRQEAAAPPLTTAVPTVPPPMAVATTETTAQTSATTPAELGVFGQLKMAAARDIALPVMQSSGVQGAKGGIFDMFGAGAKGLFGATEGIAGGISTATGGAAQSTGVDALAGISSWFAIKIDAKVEAIESKLLGIQSGEWVVVGRRHVLTRATRRLQ